jgi:hypothetical protein
VTQSAVRWMLLGAAASFMACTESPAATTQGPSVGLPASAGAAAPAAGAAGASAAAGASGATVAGSGGQSAPPAGGAPAMASGPTGAPTFTAIFKEIFTVGSAGNCMFAGCHGAPPDATLNGNLTIMYNDQPGAYQSLVNVTSTSAACMGRKLVIAGDAAGSLLMQKFTDAPPCGVKMPIGRPLTEAQLKQIETWIMQGAQDN